jgi:membrane protein
MDKTLRSLYLRLDTNSTYLTEIAESQLLVKIIYQKGHEGMTSSQVIETYKEIVKGANDSRINKILDNLINTHEVEKKKGRYSVPKRKRDEIEREQESSEARLSRIAKRFQPYYSNDEDVREWFIDSMICFFDSFSDDWMSDLCYKIDAVVRRKDSILEVIQKRTRNSKKITDKKDREKLPTKFLDIILEREPEISTLLWEYGLSSFLSKLINNQYILDDLAIESFKNSNCVLDTNILINIGLENCDYSNKIKILERIFLGLKVNVGILNITKKEYEAAVGLKRDNILKLVESYDNDVLRGTDDIFLKTAINQKCYTEEDFVRFFDQLLHIPNCVFERVPIKIFDDGSLEIAVTNAQSDDRKKKELNTLFKEVAGHDKREQALRHDVGLIFGTDHLRNRGKYFILSQEVSINAYAKKRPLNGDLPMAIRIETLLNVLALNGGEPIMQDEYKSLFADIIREELQPSSKTFQVSDLSIMLEKNEQIAKLPPDKVKDIAQEIHRLRLLGTSEQDITTRMTRMIQGAKLEITDDLKKTKVELSSEKRDNERIRAENYDLNSGLDKEIAASVRRDFRWSKCKFWLCKVFSIIAIFSLAPIILFITGVKEFVFYVLTSILNIVVYFLTQKHVPYLKNKPNTTEDFVKKEVERRKAKYIR